MTHLLWNRRGFPNTINILLQTWLNYYMHKGTFHHTSVHAQHPPHTAADYEIMHQVMDCEVCVVKGVLK